MRTSPRPTGSRSRAPISAPRGGRAPPRPRTSPRSTGSRSRASLGHAVRARPLVPRAAVLVRPLQHLEVAAHVAAVARARPLVPRATVRARPLQHIGGGHPRRAHARPLARAVLARPLQHLEVAALRRVSRARPSPRSTGSRSRAPTSAPRGGRPAPRSRAHFSTSSSFHGQSFSRALSIYRRVSARPLVPRGGRPPHLEVAARRADVARCSTGSRSRAPTSAPRGGRPSPRIRARLRPTGSRSRAPTSAPRGGHPSPRSCTSTRSTGNSPRATPSTPRDLHSRSCSAEETLVETVDLVGADT